MSRTLIREKSKDSPQETGKWLSKPPLSHVQKAVSESLDILQAQTQFGLHGGLQELSSENLYKKLGERCDSINARQPSPIRLIHHFACTGGTLISKFIAASPNVRLVSEVDPLSPIAKQQFSPLDLAAHFQQSSTTMREDEKLEVFLATLSAINRQILLRGEILVLRDHPHSHFCTGDSIPNRPTLREVIASHFPTISVVTVRHPLDSFLSLLANGFTHFSPITLEEYCSRYRAFLAAYATVPVIKYEDLLNDPECYTPILCKELKITYVAAAWDWIGGVSLTGDSGRSGDIAIVRPRREVPKNVDEMRKNSTSYKDLCRQLDYAP